LPWSDTPLSLESGIIKDQLIKLNKNGFLTINSQPRINGAHSTNEKVGWGPVGGYIFQKAYLECFVSPEKLKVLMEAMKKFPDLSFHAVNMKGDSYDNLPPNSHATAVTWGVFPGKEILQPTVVDSVSFVVWKDEAFGLWKSGWESIYEQGSKAYELLDNMINTYFLMNIVDNNFILGDIFAIFDSVIKG